MSIPSSDSVPPHQNQLALINTPPISPSGDREHADLGTRTGDQLSLLEILVTVFRRSLVVVGWSNRPEMSSTMEIGPPGNVRHVAHVTFDRFNGFLGLPDDFEPHVPRKPPSASANVFGVSTESMQLSFDSRGNSVPTILLMMQNRLYEQGGLKAEGIFRINADNSQDEYNREQLNQGLVPDGIDVHSLAGLIKAWFRELPKGVLDSLSQEHMMQFQSEEECAQLIRLLPSTEAALLDWVVNLMADVAQLETLNKMNARNVAMVFAPNMTQMSDPLTALMYAVKVMNFLQTLVIKTLREREESIVDHSSHIESTNENEQDGKNVFADENPASESPSDSTTTANIISPSDKMNGPSDTIDRDQNNLCLIISGQSTTTSTDIRKGSKNAKYERVFRSQRSMLSIASNHKQSGSERINVWRR